MSAHDAAGSVVNIAAYKFAALEDLLELQGELRTLTTDASLRGTILLSSEGINVVVAGERSGIDRLLTRLRSIPGVEDLAVKTSYSREQPFNRMLVKIKREIIAFDVPGIDPRAYASRRVSAGELKQWLDEGRPLTLLDTRNAFEVDVGTFENAVQLGVDDFRDFPAAVERLPEALKSQTIVTFCTGGIRCEKAAPYLERSGFRDVWQLDGGILKYLEEHGAAHFRGQCFVFDKRVAVDATLSETDWRQCYVCRAVLPPAVVASPAYASGVSCPSCRAPSATNEGP